MENTNLEDVQKDVYYNPDTDSKKPMWLNVLILISTAVLAYFVWRAC